MESGAKVAAVQMLREVPSDPTNAERLERGRFSAAFALLATFYLALPHQKIQPRRHALARLG